MTKWIKNKSNGIQEVFFWNRMGRKTQDMKIYRLLIKGKCIVLERCTRNIERSYVNYLNVYLINQKNKGANAAKVSGRMKVIKIRLETNEIENKEKYIFEIKKMKKKTRQIREKSDKTNITIVKNRKGDITTDFTMLKGK